MFSGDTDETPLVILKNNGVNNGNGSLQNDFESLSFSGSLPKRNRTYSRWSPIDEGVTLAWRDLSVYAKNNKNDGLKYKRIVNSVTGAVKAGSLVALIGASGAGKSSMMAALAYRTSAEMEIEGDVLINGRPIGAYMKYLSGFMHQEDIFVGALTTWEHMHIMARLKLDRRTSTGDIQNKIKKILKDLGLTKCLHTRIGALGESKALSGGEKKRLAFATELLTDPPILFCDEPTTGLDSYSAQKLVRMMNAMASSGKTILCTIHQPSSDIFAMYSQIILMAEGRIAYMGSTANAIEFFDSLGYVCPSTYNPADFFIKTLANTPGCEESSKMAIKRICDNFVISDFAKEIDLVVQYEFHMGRAVMPKHFSLRTNYKELFWWSKLYWLTHRWFLEILRDPSVQILRILQKIGIAIMVGLCYLGTNPYTQNGIQSVQGAIFLFVTENTFTPMYSVLSEFPEKTPIFIREYSAGLYHPVVYYLSRIFAMIPGLVIEPVLFVLITYWLSGLRATAYAFLMSTLIASLTMNVATACGVFFSYAFNSVPTAMAYLVPFDYVLMITSGLFFRLSSLPILFSWTKYLSWIMYSTESLSIIQWSQIVNITCEVDNLDIPCITEGEKVLEKYSFSEDNLLRDIINLFLLCVGFYCLGYFCLWWKIRRK